MNRWPDHCRAAAAKINLAIDIVGRRSDGYHEVRMVMQSLQLSDRLRFWRRGDRRVVLRGRGLRELGPIGDNLVCRAVRAVMARRPAAGGVEIELVKRIPPAAGLAGGSADAAAAIRGVDSLWQLGLSREEMMEIAAGIGSDVPFCLDGGTQLAEGRGERLTVLPSLPVQPIVLVKPAAGLATADVYRRLNLPAAVRPDIERVVAAVGAGDWRAVASAMGNSLQPVSQELQPEIGRITGAIAAGGEAFAWLMSGSGPTVFALVPSLAAGRRLRQRLRGQNPGWQCWLTATGLPPAAGGGRQCPTGCPAGWR
ncbi:MAG: 4-(cytidine 5'-diphospho)-2-C-methyl-D-erythritol kinase [Negativicutes bacterium]|nr:4-(cytidine 5'-diphospho)-2-C-methyl-D-erythritol kinase [Negativicutes bacterium]